VTRFQEAFEQYEKHRLSNEEAGELLGNAGRNFRRLCVRYEEDGVEGLRDRRIGKVSPRRAPTREPGPSDARRGTSGALPLTKVLQRSEIWVRTADNAFQRDRQSIF
jgi:hypothetical protein